MSSMNTYSDQDPVILEKILLPLLDKEKALAFLRTAVPEIMAEMEGELQEATRVQINRQLERIHRVRQRLHQAQNDTDLEHISDTHLLPRLFMDAESDIWKQWTRHDLQDSLRQAQDRLKHTQETLAAIEPGTVQYHKLREQARAEERSLFETRRNILLEWLKEEEQRVRQKTANIEITWDVATRLQTPLVVDGKVVDFVDAEITVTASTPHAFITRAFAVVVLPKDTPLVLALRRINLIRHFIPPDTALIVVTLNPEYARVLKQHNVYVYVIEEPKS